MSSDWLPERRDFAATLTALRVIVNGSTKMDQNMITGNCYGFNESEIAD